MRDTDWAHIHVRGDRARAGAYIPEARKLLGYVKQEAARFGLQTHRLQRELADGAVLVAEIHGAIPRMTITPPGGGEDGGRVQVPEQFVILPRSQALPNGLDPDVPQIMVQPGTEGWRARFHTPDVASYASYPASKGTYRTREGVPVFPDGVTHAGNIDWRGPQGQRLSWYGPSTRYFYDPYVKPASQYGRHVFLLGQVLLDSDAYIAETGAPFAARHVLGAALEGTPEVATALLVVHAALPDPPDYPTGPAGSAREVSVPWPVGDVPVEVVRYAVAPRTPVPGAAEFYTVVPGSRVVLASAVLRNPLNPFFFNASATVAVGFGLPDAVLLARDHDTNTTAAAPSPSSSMFEVTVGEAGAAITTATVSLSTDVDAEAPMACDFAGDERRWMTAVRRAPGGENAQLAFRVAGAEFPVRRAWNLRDFDPGPATRSGCDTAQHRLHWADLRVGVAIVYADQRTSVLNTVTPWEFTNLQAWRDGVLEIQTPVPRRDPNDAVFSGLRFSQVMFRPDLEAEQYGGASTVPVSPLHLLYEVYDPFPLDGSSGRFYWHGAHALYRNLAYPATETFGSYTDEAFGGGMSYREIPIHNNDDARNTVQQDVDGHYSVTGAAANTRGLLFSGHCINFGGYSDAERNVLIVSPNTPFLTLAPPQYRFHPVWLLGALSIET